MTVTTGTSPGSNRDVGLVTMGAGFFEADAGDGYCFLAAPGDRVRWDVGDRGGYSPFMNTVCDARSCQVLQYIIGPEAECALTLQCCIGVECKIRIPGLVI